MSPRPRPTQAVILAGGRGTRLGSITETIPKPMVEFLDKPFLGYIVEMLREQGFERVLMLLGYLPEVIIDHFGDGSRYGVEIDYKITAADDLTAHRVLDAQSKLDDTFLLLYCDNYWPMRFDEMWENYLASGASAQVTIYSNSDGFTRDSVIVGEDGFVDVFDRGRTTPGLSGVEISYAIIDKTVALALLPDDGQELFEVAVYPTLAARHDLAAYWSEHRYYSVGNPERLPISAEFFARLPAVLLDRDGVLNVRQPRAEYVLRPEQFRWLPGAREALRLFTEAGWRVMLITSQPGIARGMMSEGDLEDVHRKMRDEAEATGGHIDAIYYCPHGWDDRCDCRKPRPGMLFAAQREFHLDLTRTTFVGDDERDEQAARAAGCRSAMVTDDVSLLDIARELVASAAAERRATA